MRRANVIQMNRTSQFEQFFPNGAVCVRIGLQADATLRIADDCKCQRLEKRFRERFMSKLSLLHEMLEFGILTEAVQKGIGHEVRI